MPGSGPFPGTIQESMHTYPPPLTWLDFARSCCETQCFNHTQDPLRRDIEPVMFGHGATEGMIGVCGRRILFRSRSDSESWKTSASQSRVRSAVMASENVKPDFRYRAAAQDCGVLTRMSPVRRPTRRGGSDYSVMNRA